MRDNPYSIALTITNKTTSFVDEPLFVTGNFNRWNPSQTQIGHVPQAGESREYILDNLGEGELELKLCRGNWQTLNTSADGLLLPPYRMTVGGQDSSLKIDIDGWRDTFPASTASAQVHLLDGAFKFPGLNTVKKIWIYLPEDYHNSARRYPVIYMHDGQHLFDEATATGKTGPIEWQVDETIDASAQKAIVIAIESAHDHNDRKNEYLLNPSEWAPNPRGALYLRDIVFSLKPMVDEHYRTLSDAAHTAMVGSSLGGLLSLYAGLHYPEVFGSVGVLSPSIWMDDQEVLRRTIEEFSAEREGEVMKQHYYIYGGQLETRTGSHTVAMVENAEKYAVLLQRTNAIKVELSINPLGKHGSWYWQKEFPKFYQWWHNNLS